MTQPFRVNPSLVARYFFHDCDRFLRFAATPATRQHADGVPVSEPDTSPVMAAIREAGYAWEETVIGTHLVGRVLVAPGEAGAKFGERRFDREETLNALRTAKAGEFIYQGSLRTPKRFYDRFGMDPNVVVFSDNHPDLIAVLEHGGVRRYRVIDIKRSDTAKAVHRIQILLYAWQLREILTEHAIDGEVDVSTGGVWLGNADAPIEVDLDPVRTHVARFLKDDLPRVCREPAADAAWHLHFRCEWCDYFEHCRTEMRATDDVSRIASLTGFGKRFLTTRGVGTVGELATWLDSANADADLSHCASLAGRGHLLRGQAEAFTTGRPIIHGASSMALPRGENVAVFLTAQEEPLGNACYMAGVLVSLRQELRDAITGGTDAPKAAVWVADSPDGVSSVAVGVIQYLDTLFENLAAYNLPKEWAQQLSVQCYVHNAREQAVFVRMLLSALEIPSAAEAAMRLLLHFSSPDLANAESQPDEPVAYPLVVLLAAQAQILALPVDTSYTLPESLASLGSAFTYARDPLIHFPLGHGLRPDGIHKVWAGKLGIATVRGHGKSMLAASRALLAELRTTATDQLVAWPPKFTMPGTNGIASPLLARLAFFARFESVIACLEIRALRADAREVQRQRGTIVELEATAGAEFSVINGPADLDADSMANWLLVPDNESGRVASVRFPDYAARNKRWYGSAASDRAIVDIATVTNDTAGIATALSVSFCQKFKDGFATAGDRYILFPRFTDWTTDRVVSWLRAVDATMPSALVDLLESPHAELLPLHAGVEQRVSDREPALKLTPSQVEAFRALRTHDNVVVWGPPGTGKTHFLAASIATLVAAHRAENKPFRVLVTASTHAAIENVLRAVAKALETDPSGVGVLIWKAGPWNGSAQPIGVEIAAKSFAPALADQPQVVVGATVYTCLKANPTALFDLVVVDEASQMRLPEASVPLMLRHESGRLLLAGDHQQLAPIVHGVWPDPVAGPAIHGSILTALRVEGDSSLGLQLHENWRMNATLTALSGRFIYGDAYQCANDLVANHRLRWYAPAGVQPFAQFCLDPRFSFVVVVLDGVTAGKENVREAELVSSLVRSLRDGLVTDAGVTYADDRAFFHGDGTRGAGVFVVSPHHVQIAAIRKALAAEGLSHPFVDTVEKMQGQEAEAVLVSYGVSDPEFAMQEAAFIYGRHRLNVAMTRARAKVVLFLPRPLLDAPPGVLDVEEAVEGLSFMRELYELAANSGERNVFDWADGVSAEVVRFGDLV